MRGLHSELVYAEGTNSNLKTAIGNDWKGWVSPALYATAVPMAFLHTAASQAIYITVAALWLIPDRRMERVRGANHSV
jgi:hypothetical protein